MEPIFIKEFLPENILHLSYNYCLLKFKNKDQLEADRQTTSFIGQYGEYYMETLLDMSTSVIERNVGKKLWPTYSYFRIYDKGSDLPIHIDRPSCEYTVALCLGAQPHNEPYEIFIGEADINSDYKYWDSKRNYNRYRIDHKIPMLPNNALIFQGMNKIHWREYCNHDHFITVFLHYVDQEGPYKEYKFDKRESIGETHIKKESIGETE